MKHLALVPLIGGMAIGAERAIGAPPEAVLSYTAFEGNDKFYMNYLAQRGLDIQRYAIDDVDVPTFSDIDIVTSVCPCAGLSTVTSNAGPGCQQNEWMKLSTKFILQHARPRVLIGENAPALATNGGRPVAHILRDIGKEFGYSMQLVKTSTHLHGIPQERTRSFFLLYRDGKSYEIEWSANEFEGSWVDYLHAFEDVDDEVDLKIGEWHNEMWALGKRIKQMNDDEFADYLMSERRTVLLVCMEEGKEESLDYIEKHIDSDDAAKKKAANTINRNLTNRTEGRGLWDSSVLYRREKNYKAVMWRTLASLWHPVYRRPLKVREQMRLMGLPEDFKIPRANPNAICQNVPTCTAEWMVREAIAALNGERKEWDGEGSLDGILRQNNINRRLIK